VLRMVRTENLEPKDEEESKHDPGRLDLLAGFQEAVVNMLWSTTEKAVGLMRPRSLILSGGVAANSRLKEVLAERCAEAGVHFHCPRPIFTTDNAAMIAAAGTAKFMRGETVDMTANADPNMRLAPTEKDFPVKRWRT